MEKTKTTKSLAFKTMLRLFIIIIIVSLIAAVVIGVTGYINSVNELLNYTYEAAIKGTAVTSSADPSEKNRRRKEQASHFRAGDVEEANSLRGERIKSCSATITVMATICSGSF